MVLLITAVASGSAGYCLGRYRTDSGTHAAFAAGDGYGADRASAADESLSSSRVGEFYPPRAPVTPSSSSEERKRRAVKHWNAGIIFFQAGKYDKSRDEWLLCKQFDPANSDCDTGLARLDSSYGGGS
ncbi:MAG: hypothetical protein AUJ52_02075 [Elusimicrobia bacterium CG1_02_63_36]|nr:MAG: hypothetical protein AUJ52_02075 [Elusimicrobia bacterium CG1_02_63_36]